MTHLDNEITRKNPDTLQRDRIKQPSNRAAILLHVMHPKGMIPLKYLRVVAIVAMACLKALLGATRLPRWIPWITGTGLATVRGPAAPAGVETEFADPLASTMFAMSAECVGKVSPTLSERTRRARGAPQIHAGQAIHPWAARHLYPLPLRYPTTINTSRFKTP